MTLTDDNTISQFYLEIQREYLSQWEDKHNKILALIWCNG